MTQLALLAGGLLLVAAAAGAQRPQVPIIIGNSEPMACSTARMAMLRRTPDLFAVRSGPSRRSPVLARLRAGDPVFACGRRGNWFAIVYAPRGQRMECGVSRRWRSVARYRGPCRSGWVHYDHIGEYADWISP